MFCTYSSSLNSTDCARALRGCHSVPVSAVVPGPGPVPGVRTSQGSIRGQLESSARAFPRLPGAGGAGGPNVVPRQNEPAWRWETSEKWRGLSRPQEHYQPRVLRADRHAQWNCQTPTAGGPWRHGKMMLTGHTEFVSLAVLWMHEK